MMWRVFVMICVVTYFARNKCVTSCIAPEVCDVSYFTRDVKTVVVQVPQPVLLLFLLSPDL